MKIKEFAGEEELVTELGVAANSIDLSKVPLHKKPEQVRDEIPTLNMFGYMKFELEEFGQDFLDLAAKATKPVLEIGSAYGFMTHKALEMGAKVVAADIGKEHLEVLLKEAPKDKLDNLFLVQGAFPDEMDFPQESFDAILISRVLHFLEGETIERGLDKMHGWLAKGGKLVCVNCSLYHSSIKEKMAETFQKRIAEGDKWVGVVRQKQEKDSVHEEYCQTFLNVFYMEQLEALLPQHGFKIEKIKYFDYPSDPWLDEDKGHIGFVATKI